MSKFNLNEEEISVLKIIKKYNDKNQKIDFYNIVNELETETTKMIPVFSRLEDDEYVKSYGIIYRYFKLTEKGLAKL